MRTVAAIFLLILVAALAATLVLALSFSRQIAAREARLAAAPAATIREDLPPKLRAFARRGMLGAAPAAAVRLEQAAEMRLSYGADWAALDAHQVISAPVPGFAWVAAMKAGPLPLVRVLDGFEAGEGRLEVRALGAWRFGLEDGPEAAVGEAMRYLAELPWCPDAILTGREVIWAETGDRVTARIETAGGPAEVAFRFDDAGDIAEMNAKARPATGSDGQPTLLAWRGQFRDYREIGGRRIPVSGEVGYLYPEGYQAYWRGTITAYKVLASAAN